MRKKKPTSARAARREGDREVRKDLADRDKLAKLAEGGAPERPIVVPSASVIEPIASSSGCTRCGGTLRVDEHAAKTMDGAPLRVVTARCTQCGTPRTIYFRIVVALPN